MDKHVIFSQKLTSWVFNDQPCECADVGQSRTTGRPAKIGWEKKGLRSCARARDTVPVIAFLWTRSDFIYTNVMS